MNQYRNLIRFLVLLLCFGLVQSVETVSAQKRRSKSRRTRRTAPTPRKSFDEMIGVNGAVTSSSSDLDGGEQTAAQIDENRLRAHLKFLADDLLEGRGPGTRGGLIAAKYIAAQFEALGLEPAATDRTYFQQVQMIGSKVDPSNQLTIKSNSSEAQFKFGDDFVANTDLEENEVSLSSEIVFVGYGISAPEYNWDDYKGLDVRGKTLMIMVNDPPATAVESNLFGGRALTYYGRWIYKFEEAARRGAAGVILIHSNESAGYGWSVIRNSFSGERYGLVPDANAPGLRLKAWVTEDVARRIAKMSEQNLDQLRQSAVTREFRPVSLNLRVDMKLKVSHKRMVSPNVAAILRGSDSNLRNEYVIYSAHWDHLGIRPDQQSDNIYNGAVDNASGISGLIGIAQALSSLDVKPKRSIIFLATTAEEQGLLGAAYYTRHPLVPLAKTVANINLDSMNVIGLTTDITPLGAERSTLGKFIEGVARDNQVTISPDPHPEQGSFYRSDHFPFAKAGVPAVSFNPGTHFVGHSDKWGEERYKEYVEKRYHQPADEYSPNWDFSGLVQQTRLAFLVGFRVANSIETPQWNKGDEFERERRRSAEQ